jgi:uncharacterized membrane protein YfcA
VITDPARLAWLGLAAVAGGAVNAVAGGGSLITFPVGLAVGLSPVAANATNTVAMTPGGIASAIAYRRELGPRRRVALVLALPAAVGGALGAFGLLSAPPRVFELLVPWLVFGATILIVLRDRLARGADEDRSASTRQRWAVAIGVGVAAIYGGYFGAGVGIVLLALLALLGRADIHQLNAMKSVVNAAINGSAAIYLLARHAADPLAAPVMAVGAVIGGFFGAALARRTRPAAVRWLVVGIGLALSVVLALRYWSSGLIS